MAENKITLGQLVTVLTESGIDLNEIYLDENQVNGMQTSLSEENQKKLVGFVSNLMQSVPDDELSEIGGGELTKEEKEKLKKYGWAALGTVLGVGTVLYTGIELMTIFGHNKFRDKLNNRTPISYLINQIGKKKKPDVLYRTINEELSSTIVTENNEPS